MHANSHPFRIAIIAFAAILASFSLSYSQISLTIGGDEAEIKRALLKQGYTRIDFTGRGFTKFRAQACKEGLRYKFKVDWRGKTNDRKVIGKCRRTVGEEQIRQALRKNGYRRINMEAQNGLFVAIACREGRRFRVEVNQYGDIRKERRIGRCQQELSPTDIEVALKQEGFDRFKWFDRQLPRYVVQACRDRRLLELTLNRRGEVRKSVDRGACRQQINPDDLPAILAAKGYERAKVTDDRLPGYGAIACRDGKKLELTLNRYGRITNQIALGNCRRQMSGNQIVAYVEEQGFKRVSYGGKSTQGHTISACFENDRYRFVLNTFGELVNEERLGNCKSRSLFDIVDRLAERGATSSRIFVETCRKGRLIRIEFDAFGERIGRERIGNCK